MSVTEEGRKGHPPVCQLGVGIDDTTIFGIGYDARMMLHYLYPLGLRTQDDAGSLEEEGLFLHTAAVGHH